MKQTPAEQERDSHVAMMRDEDSWPHWPILPLKRRVDGSGWPEVAVMFGDTDNGQVAVYLSSMFQPITTSTPKLVYDSHEAAYADGWRID